MVRAETFNATELRANSVAFGAAQIAHGPIIRNERGSAVFATLPESAPSLLLSLSLEQHTQLHRYPELD
ncbi:Uncharacterised protein [Corynebacterium diphtheriae bv. mitis]|nr:hypothetical protein CDPW8_0056 [Corynebacterium diphtheriae PW8]OKY23704.1 hypothetical protein AO271_08150 [Corynebacterium diphtheriae]CAB0578497.1 hypothetical protein CIP107554_00092 [Corynebacterium diphtheriae]SUY72892.1 Uncharacterised protein [Corynebacterium diphtheriae bv. mitis]